MPPSGMASSAFKTRLRSARCSSSGSAIDAASAGSREIDSRSEYFAVALALHSHKAKARAAPRRSRRSAPAPARASC